MAVYKQDLLDEIAEVLGEQSVDYLQALKAESLRDLKATLLVLADTTKQQTAEEDYWVECIEVVVCEPGEGPRFMRQPKKTTMLWEDLCVAHPRLARRIYAEMEPGEVARQMKRREK